MKNIPLLLGTLIGTILLIAGVAIFFSNTSTSVQTADSDLLTGRARLFAGGGESPKVTVVEFSDFQCPACRAAQPLVEEIKTKYPDQVKVVYRHYPLITIHPYAQLAAQAAEAAATENKFWEMHDKLFLNQDTWAEMGGQNEVKEQFVKYAEELGIDKTTFLEKIESDDIKRKVAEDVADGNALNIQATPTFYVNNQKVNLSAPQQLLSTVEELLK